MTTVVLFHHVLGLTEGVRALADRLDAGVHRVLTPDLFEGERAATIDEGLALIERTGEDVLARRADAAVADLPADVVFAGISWGVMAAQRFAQTRPGARGALLYEACLPITGDWAIGPWPDGVAVQVHGMAEDPFFAHEGDLDAAREIVAAIGPERAELFTYPGDAHLFVDSSLPSFDAAATDLVLERSLRFLDRV